MFFKSKAQSPQGKIKYIVAGLGNPGQKYMYTRHNAGFLALDYISQKYDFKITNVNFKSLCGRHTFESNAADEEDKRFDVLFMKPQTYMNNSGQAVSEAALFYKLPVENILVISDDVRLPVGKIRIRKRGSDGGQKGLESIIYHLGSHAFPRIRIGVGDIPHPNFPLERWVLTELEKGEQKAIFEVFGNVYEAVDIILRENDIEKAMNKFN